VTYELFIWRAVNLEQTCALWRGPAGEKEGNVYSKVNFECTIETAQL
jgi:hypothetical protein